MVVVVIHTGPRSVADQTVTSSGESGPAEQDEGGSRAMSDNSLTTTTISKREYKSNITKKMN